MRQTKELRIAVTFALLIGIWLVFSCAEAPFDTTNQDCPSGWFELGVTTERDFIRDYNYEQGLIYSLGPDTLFEAGDSIKNLIIYEFESNPLEPEAVNCHLHIDPSDPSYKTNLREDILMVQIEPERFVFYEDPSKSSPYVIFDPPRYTTNAIGMYLEIGRAGGAVDTIGDLSGDEPILMILQQYEANAHPDHEPWWYMWRNAYSVPKNIPVDELEITVWKGEPGQEYDPASLDYQHVDGQNQGSYLKILGLDQYDVQGQPGSDGLVDDRFDIFRSDLGLLIFPHRTPFDSDTTFGEVGDKTAPLADRRPALYFGTESERYSASAYYISYGQRYRPQEMVLPCTNITPYSERVRFNGLLQTREVDYVIAYEPGMIFLISHELRDPDGFLEIKFR